MYAKYTTCVINLHNHVYPIYTSKYGLLKLSLSCDRIYYLFVAT